MGKFIDIEQLIKSKNPRLAKWLPGFVLSYLRRVLHEEEINAFIASHKEVLNEDFCDAVVNYFNIKVAIKGIERIPKTGPIIITMNHPLGGMDALALVSGIRHHRSDMRFIVNDLLMNLTNLRGLFVGVNKHGKNQVSTRQEIMQLFESDEAVCIFPAGMVSRIFEGKIQDSEWKKTFVTYALKHDQPIIPIYIDGKLTPRFYRIFKWRKFFGIKANLEMFYLADELFKQRDKTITFSVGEPIYSNQLNSELTEQELAQYVKEVVYSIPKHS
jgi:putative hemolysin